MTKKKASPKNIIKTKDEELDDYDGFDEEVMMEREEKYASHIGAFLMWFSSLENGLDIAIAELIDGDHHHDTYLILKDMEVSKKIELFNELSLSRLAHVNKRQKLKENQLKSIIKELTSLMVLRNKIAHAKWYSLDKEGYVRVDTKIAKDKKTIVFRRFRITPVAMKRGMSRSAALEDKIFNFIEELWN